MIGKPVALMQVPNQRGFPVREAAKYLGVHPNRLRDMSDIGEIPCRRIGTHRHFLLEDLDRWLESQPKWVSNGNS